MFRQWIESRASRAERLVRKTADRSGLVLVVKTNWIEFLYIGAIVVLSGGAVSALASPVSQQYIIYPSTGGETISEVVIYAMASLLGFGGLYLSHISGKPTVNPRMVKFFLTLGLIMITVAVYIEMYVFVSK